MLKFAWVLARLVSSESLTNCAGGSGAGVRERESERERGRERERERETDWSLGPLGRKKGEDLLCLAE
jgi:hypothetical protein